MSDSTPKLPHGELPPIPEGCGILPVAENRIAPGPHPELLDQLPEGFVPHPLDEAPPTADEVPDDALEQASRRVLARAYALSAGLLLVGAAAAWSTVDPTVPPGPLEWLTALSAPVRLLLIVQFVFAVLCSRYVEKLGIVAASVLLFAYTAFSTLEFSLILTPRLLTLLFVCTGLMYAVTAAAGYLFGLNLASPLATIGMIASGGAILAAINSWLGNSHFVWGICSVAVLVFAGIGGWKAQEIRDFYQDFDDDNPAGWKASVVGALVLMIYSFNIYLLLAALAPERDDDRLGHDGL
jgi:FtsH-binding integral membrane protein